MWITKKIGVTSVTNIVRYFDIFTIFLEKYQYFQDIRKTKSDVTNNVKYQDNLLKKLDEMFH